MLLYLRGFPFVPPTVVILESENAEKVDEAGALFLHLVLDRLHYIMRNIFQTRRHNLRRKRAVKSTYTQLATGGC